MNIRCSNRCAKPVRPGFSRAEPTWYQTFTVDDRHAVILVQDHVQAVGQRELRVGQLEFGGAAASGGGGHASATASEESSALQHRVYARASTRTRHVRSCHHARLR